MDPGPESHTGPQVPLSFEQTQFLNLMLDGQHYQDDADTPDDANMPIQEEEESEESEDPYYETDSGTDSNEDLHSGAEPFWRDLQAQTSRQGVMGGVKTYWMEILKKGAGARDAKSHCRQMKNTAS